VTAESTDVLLSYGPAFPWQVFAGGAALLALAFLFRRARWALLTLAGLCFVGAWLL
jgi:hypothetical protein